MRLYSIYLRDILGVIDLDEEEYGTYTGSRETLIEGEETKRFIKKLRGIEAEEEGDSSEDDEEEEDDDEGDDLPILKYEAPFCKKKLLP